MCCCNCPPTHEIYTCMFFGSVRFVYNTDLKLNLYKTYLFIYHLYLDIFSFFSFRVSKGLVV
ncbi:hypothetical protein BGV07_13205 [Clostridioides difficile]|nr:hypothetical protein BGV07_13205 [Clostridioides difficile]